MDKNNQSSIRIAVNTICATAVPFVLKWLTVLDQQVYYVLLGIGLLLSIVFLVLLQKEDRKQKFSGYFITSLGFTLAIGLCFLIYPRMVKPEEQIFSVTLDNSYLKKYEEAAAKGDTLSMEKLGIYFATSSTTDVIPKDGSEKRLDDFYDKRDFLKAEKYLEMAASHGSSAGYFLLGIMKMEGWGCIPSRLFAIKYFEEALKDEKQVSGVLDAIRSYGITEEEFPLAYASFPELKNE